jgi:crotonobetainyl-CoA:carnitine CoA-transferase CaiB-like acyl-CoA transferase
MYRASDGWIAIAALEPHFAKRLASELGLTNPTHTDLEQRFSEHGARWWQEWAAQRDLPLVALK